MMPPQRMSTMINIRKHMLKVMRKISKILKMYLKPTMMNEISLIRLESEDAEANCFGTIAPVIATMGVIDAYCALLQGRLYSIDDVEMDEFNPFNPEVAKTLDKFCGDGGSITVVNGAGGSIPVVVDEAMGAAAVDTLQPDVRLRDEVVPE
eukprot:scaffold345970_cov57-Attheya_sp.AAC.1